MKTISNSLASCVLALSILSGLAAENDVKPRAKKAALLVQNRAGAEYNDKVPALEDAVASRAAGTAFSFINREDVLNAVKVYPTDTLGEADRNALGTKLDRLLSDNSSAVRLAQNMGADFLLVVTITSVGKETRNFNDPSIGVQTANTVYTLRTGYKLLDAGTGGTLAGDAIRSTKTIRQTATLKTDTSELLNELFEDASTKIAQSIATKGNVAAETRAADVAISIACSARDLQGHELSLPDLRLGEDGKVVTSTNVLPVQVSATVEIDGFARGTTPVQLKIAPGPHKVRLTRPGFEPVELTVNATEGLALTPTMQLSAEGLTRWRDIRSFLNGLDASRKITGALAEEIRGNAQRLRQSGFLVDYRVNAKEAPKIQVNKSIYSVD